MADTIPKWQRRRAEFNHDWLKNVYLIRIDEFLNLLDDKIEDQELERRFVRDILKSWETHAKEAVELVIDFESEMSPRKLLDRPPLSNCSESQRAWLGDLVHQLWLARYPVREWISTASMRARDVDTGYGELMKELESCEDTQSVHALRRFRPAFARFRDQCQDLAKAIEQFHREVKVV